MVKQARSGAKLGILRGNCHDCHSHKYPTVIDEHTAGGLGILLNRLVNRWVAGIIARCEREAAGTALRRRDDRELKDIGIDRQLGDTSTEMRQRMRLQRREQTG